MSYAVPRAGDVFAAKTDLWPVEPKPAEPAAEKEQEKRGFFWL